MSVASFLSKIVLKRFFSLKSLGILESEMMKVTYYTSLMVRKRNLPNKIFKILIPLVLILSYAYSLSNNRLRKTKGADRTVQMRRLICTSIFRL